MTGNGACASGIGPTKVATGSQTPRRVHPAKIILSPGQQARSDAECHARTVGLAGFLYVSLDWFSGPRTRDPLGVALQNHTPIERPAQGLSFGAGLDSLRVQLLIPDPLARPTGWT
jgi:hypothetical protein